MVLVFVLFSITGFAQRMNIKTDLQLIESIADQAKQSSEKRSYIFRNQPKTLLNCNPVSLLYGGSLYVYQNFVSQHFSATCLYDPSCSDFSKQAVKNYGLLKGGLLSFDRLSRCNRIAATDLDPALFNKKSHRFNDPVTKYK